MYHYIQEKDFQKRMKRVCSDFVNRLVQSINNDSVMRVRMELVGSGAKNLITQNEKEPVDLDYNICIISTNEVAIRDGREIKEYIRKKFNMVLHANGWSDCKDSKSVLTTEKWHFVQGNKTEFSIDLAIVYEDCSGWHRLIHKKTGRVSLDQYCWNKVSDSRNIQQKVEDIKSEGLWQEVRDIYLKKKNFYLCRNDYNHPSFVVYIETINEIYNKYW